MKDKIKIKVINLICNKLFKKEKIKDKHYKILKNRTQKKIIPLVADILKKNYLFFYF